MLFKQADKWKEDGWQKDREQHHSGAKTDMQPEVVEDM